MSENGCEYKASVVYMTQGVSPLPPELDRAMMESLERQLTSALKMLWRVQGKQREIANIDKGDYIYRVD